MSLPLAYVVGRPVSHSRSPLIHGHWLAEYGIAGAYERRDVGAEEVEAFLRGIAARGERGGNVTLPHKEAALRAADVATDRARAIGAANTLWVEGGRLHADNTDGLGFLACLDDEAPGWDAAQDGRAPKAVVLGAGGASRAVLHALRERGVAVQLLNRDEARATRLGAEFGAEAGPLTAAGEALRGASLLVNATSLGMTGQPPLALDLSPLPQGATVFDAIYVPLETPLLAQARARGLRAVGGLGMLLHQAVPGFERWFGVRPRVTPALRALVERDVLGVAAAGAAALSRGSA